MEFLEASWEQARDKEGPRRCADLIAAHLLTAPAETSPQLPQAPGQSVATEEHWRHEEL